MNTFTDHGLSTCNGCGYIPICCLIMTFILWDTRLVFTPHHETRRDAVKEDAANIINT